MGGSADEDDDKAEEGSDGEEELTEVEPAIRLDYSDFETDWPLENIEAFLIDLDGTIYQPSGPVEGAAEFYASVLRHKPHVFLSNTGAKGADGVRAKLARNGIIMGKESQSCHVYTAAQAQCRYMIDVIPHGARVFVIAGGDADGPGSYWMQLLRVGSKELISSWDIRTHLTDDMAREWAAAAAAGLPVFVVLFSDGSISAVKDPSTGEAGFADWSYDVIKKTSYACGSSLVSLPYPHASSLSHVACLGLMLSSLHVSASYYRASRSAGLTLLLITFSPQVYPFARWRVDCHLGGLVQPEHGRYAAPRPRDVLRHVPQALAPSGRRPAAHLWQGRQRGHRIHA